MADAIRELQSQVRELRAAVSEMRSEAAAYRAETAELRHELEAARAQALAPSAIAGSETFAVPAANSGIEAQAVSGKNLEDRVASLEESSQLLSSKVDEQYQTKVEGASKYRIRLSGVVLMNLFGNRGTVDNQDVPTIATVPGPLDASGTFGATMRQSELGLEIFGPRVAGARTSGQLQLDFAGGFPNTLDGGNYGLIRLRIGSLRMDWQRTSIVAGQDGLFLSPLSPTSYASLAVPALGYAGNLWGWIPQIRVEHRFDFADQSITLQGGIIDNMVGEPPYAQVNRLPSSGEKTSQPAFGTRIAWSRSIHGQPLKLGMAGYYSRQNWGLERYTDGWAGMADWQIPLWYRLSLSGEFYRGRAMGGLGGADGRSALYSGNINTATTEIIGLDTVGGWSQVKFRATPKLEFNGAFGLDNPYAEDLRLFPVSQSYYSPFLAQNRSGMLNFVYWPRSNLLVSTEYRRLRTFQVNRNAQTAGQINLTMGILF